MSMELRQERSLPVLMAWRQEVINSVFDTIPDFDLLQANRDYYTRHIKDGSHVAIIASCDGEDCGCGAVCFHEEMPSPDNPSGRCAYLMNIYVRSASRRCGVAHAIVAHLIGLAKDRGVTKIYLETTSAGRKIYESLGFTNMQDMMKL